MDSLGLSVEFISQRNIAVLVNSELIQRVRLLLYGIAANGNR